MYSTFLVLTILTSLATAAPLSPESSVPHAGLVTRDLQDLGGYGRSTEANQARSDGRVSLPSQRAAQIATRQLQLSDIVSGQRISGDAMEQFGSGILAEGFGTRIKRSVDELSKTFLEWVKSTAKSSVKKHTRDTSESLSPPKSRTYWRPVAGARSGGRGKGGTRFNELLAESEASGAQDEASVVQAGGNNNNNNNNNNNGAEGGGHVANVGGQGNGLAFGQAVRFPEK